MSVALCTYNGARHVRQQLESIARQSRPVDEVVVRDDGSRDDTVAIVEAFARSAPFAMDVRRNATNLGVARNFEAAARACTGDVLFFCDQDDVWLPEKVATMLAPFVSRPEAGVVFSDATVVGDDLSPRGHTMWEGIGFGPGERRRFLRDPYDVLFRHNVVTGAAMAMRADLRDAVFPVAPGWIHDAWIAVQAALVADIVPVETPTILYRQHGANVTGATVRTRRDDVAQNTRWATSRMTETLRRDHSYWAAAATHARDRVPVRPDRIERLQRLEERVLHLGARAHLPRSRVSRIKPILEEWRSGRYRRHSGGAPSAVKDLLLS